MQIVFLDSKPIVSDDADISPLKKYGIVSLYPRTAPALLKQRLKGADIVLTNRVFLDELSLQSANCLKLICLLENDLSLVAYNAAAKKNIPVCYIPEYATDDIAQHTVAILLELCSHIGYHDRRIHNGAWCSSQDYCWWEKPLVSLAGKTAGIIGTGRVGSAVSKILTAFGVDVIGFDIQKNDQFAGKYVSLKELLTISDIVSLHCTLNTETRGLINNESLSQIKQGAILLNTSSGKLVSESDVCASLVNGKLGGYGTDTVSVEPITVHNPLMKAPNCILSAHCSCSSLSSRQKLIESVSDTIESFLNGRPVNLIY